MIDAQTLDAEIARMYTTGESTMVISKRLGMRPAEVISRVRALNLTPPSMGMRRPAAEGTLPQPGRILAPEALIGSPEREWVPAPAPVTPASPSPAPERKAPALRLVESPGATKVTEPKVPEPRAAETKPHKSAAPKPVPKARPMRSMGAQAVALMDEDDEDLDDLATLPGRPRGWLVTETEMNAIFARHRGRFEDVRLRKVGR